MYQAFSMIVSFIALAIVSSSALFVSGNNRNIDLIKDKTTKINDNVLAQNELTKKQILSLINNVNENDAKIMSQHKKINNTMKKVEKESKLRTENVDSRLRSFKNITNANVVAITDNVATNDRNINSRVDVLDKKVDDNKTEINGTINQLRTDHDDLDSRHQSLSSDYLNNKDSVIKRLQDESVNAKNYTDSKHNDVMNTIQTRFNAFASEQIQMDDAAKNVMTEIKNLTEKQLNELKTGYPAADTQIRTDLNNKINVKDAEYKTQFLYSSRLKDEVNAKFFTNKPYQGLDDMIKQTKLNQDNIASNKQNILDNDNKIETIKRDFVKTSDLSTKMNTVMPTTDIYKDVQANKTQLTELGTKVNTNIETIKTNNTELQNMLKGITGGLSGEISLKDLNDRIAKNAENIEKSAAQNNREMMREVRKETGGLDAKIQKNSEDITKKLDNNKNEYAKAFNEYISDQELVNKMKGKPIEAQSIKLNDANIEKDLIVNGTKFSTVVKNLENVVGSMSQQSKSGARPVARYDKDFTSGTTKISPNRTVRFRDENSKLELKDTELNMDDTDFKMENGTMNVLNSTLNWSTYGNNTVNMTGDGVNLNSTNVKMKNFDQLKANDETLTKFIDSQIQKSQTSSTSALGNQINAYMEANDLRNSKSITTPRLYIGDQYTSMDVKKEINDLKNSTNNSLAANQVRQDARFFSKQKPEDLHNSVRSDFRNNYDKYLPNTVAVGAVETDKVLGLEEMTFNDGGINGLNKIKLNGQGLKNVLDDLYESKGTAENALSNKKASIKSIQSIDNRLLLTYTDNTSSYVDLPNSNSGDRAIHHIEVDEANNRLKIRRKDNSAESYKLPDYKKSIDLTPYALKSEYAPNYKENQGNVVYLDNTKKSRLDTILQNDAVKNLSTTAIPSTTEVSSLKTNVGVLDTKMTSVESDINSIKAGQREAARNINLTKLNEYTKNNPVRSDNYIALNNKVSLKVSGDRLQMCQAFDSAGPTNCHDLWTTKDIGTIDTRTIKR